jgi:fibrillarin-like rRNA methylase
MTESIKCSHVSYAGWQAKRCKYAAKVIEGGKAYCLRCAPSKREAAHQKRAKEMGL